MKTVSADTSLEQSLNEHLFDLKNCKQCPNMIGPVVTHTPVLSKVYLVGQAPGPREGSFGRPFAWTAGKTLFSWFESIGINEQQFRTHAYMAAVCRCFPGKTSGGGDRVPTSTEVRECSSWMKQEIDLLLPELIIPVGRLAILQFIGDKPLVEIVGKQFRSTTFGHKCDVIPLPHSSGVSSWFKKEPGKSLLLQALSLLAKHPAWIKLRQDISLGI